MAGRLRSMRRGTPQPNTLTPAQRGQIVQRVIVDGWTIADAAAAARVPERLVKTWVASYRRHGMRSLRHRAGKAGAFEIGQLWLSRPARGFVRGVRWLLGRDRRAAKPSPIRGPQDDRREG